jgi:Flp pilus assembly protein CpaB
VKRSNRLVILVGVLLAVLAFVAILILLNQDNDGGGGGPTATPTQATVLVATQDIELAEPVTPDMVEVQQVPPDAVIGTALTDPSQLQGQPALLAVPAGSQVSGQVIGQTPGEDICIACMLNPGEKAIAFQVDRATGLDFLITAGDSIDILVRAEISVLQETADSAANTDPNAPPRFEAAVGLEDQPSVKAILQDKRVLYVSATRADVPEPVDTNEDGVVDEQDQQPEQATIDSVMIIFAGSAQDAEVIKFAQNAFGDAGPLTAIVRHADDDQVERTTGITIDQLVEEYGLRIPDIVEQLNEEGPSDQQ